MDLILTVVILIQIVVGTGFIKKGYYNLNEYFPDNLDSQDVKIGRLNKIGVSKPFLVITIVLFILVIAFGGNNTDYDKTSELLNGTCWLSIIYNGVNLVGSFFDKVKRKGCWGLIYYMILTLAYGFTYTIVVFKHLTNIF